MLSKSEKRLIEGLRRPRRRSKEKLILVEGIRTVDEALSTNIEVSFCLRSPKLLTTDSGKQLVERLDHNLKEVRDVSDTELGAISDTANSQGVLLVCHEPSQCLSDFGVEATSTLLIIDGVQDPGNLVTLIRAARAFDISAVIALEGTTDFWNAKVVRSSVGSIFHSQVFSESWEYVASWLERNSTVVLAADAQGTDITECNVKSPWALVVGNENKGIRKNILDIAKKIAIPMSKDVESLNAGVAGSTLLYLLTTK